MVIYSAIDKVVPKVRGSTATGAQKVKHFTNKKRRSLSVIIDSYSFKFRRPPSKISKSQNRQDNNLTIVDLTLKAFKSGHLTKQYKILFQTPNGCPTPWSSRCGRG